MQRIRVKIQQKSLTRKKQTKYKDSTRIKFEHFNFSKNELDVLDKFNVTNLISIFENENCFQQNSRHHVTIVIDWKQLHFVIYFTKKNFVELFDNAQIERFELQLFFEISIWMFSRSMSNSNEKRNDFFFNFDESWIYIWSIKSIDFFPLIFNLQEEYTGVW